MRTDESVTMRIDMHGTPAENLQRLITDCGVSPHKVQELIQELPPKPFADRLIDWFFCNLNLVRYPIDERLFRICKCACGGTGTGPSSLLAAVSCLPPPL